MPGTLPGGSTRTIRETLRDASLPRSELQLLWQHVLGKPRSWLIAHDADTLAEEDVERFLQLRQRRQAGEPMAYLLGEREFMGHAFRVSPAVLIPRPETEHLVEHALAEAGSGRVRRVLDMGTGSGAIAVSIALANPALEVVATDASPEALVLAQDNARRLSANVCFLHGDWYDALEGQARFDMIVSNPPYIDSRDRHLEQGDLRFEPSMALTDGADGLQALRAIVDGAAHWLNPGGSLWLEHGWNQAASVRVMLAGAGFADVKSLTDLAGIERISGGRYL